MKSVQFVVHCWGPTTFSMSMLAGLQGVPSFVAWQIATNSFAPIDVRLKTGLHVPDFLDAIGIHTLDAKALENEGWLKKEDLQRSGLADGRELHPGAGKCVPSLWR